MALEMNIQIAIYVAMTFFIGFVMGALNEYTRWLQHKKDAEEILKNLEVP